ncbi:hypothetical protein V2J09_007240 [Rumex salicifolius]
MNYENRDFCYFHPKQILVGVCPLCLNERLLVVAAKEGRRSHLRPRLLRRRSYQEGGGQSGKSGNNVGLTKMFALRSLLNRLELRHRHSNRRRSDDIGSDYQSTSTSLEDSFISIKFEDNGVASWDKTKHNFTNTKPTGFTDPKKPTNSVVEHLKTPRGTLRWRKRIGHLLQLVKWKKSNHGNGGTTHVDGVKGVVNARRNGWIKTFTRRKNSQE